VIRTEPVVVGVNVTKHFAVEFSVHVAALREPVEFVVNDTVPDGDNPAIETEILDGELTVTDDGESVRVVVVNTLFTVRVDCPELAALFVLPLYFPVIITEPAVDGVNVTEHIAVELRLQVAGLREPDPLGTVNVTVPVGDKPDTETETLVETPTSTDDGESVTVVVADTGVTVRVFVVELAALFVSPLYFPVITTEPADDGVNVTEHVPDTSVQDPPLLKEPPDGTLNDTVPVANTVPDTETETVVGTPTSTDDGESVRVVVVWD